MGTGFSSSFLSPFSAITTINSGTSLFRALVSSPEGEGDSSHNSAKYSKKSLKATIPSARLSRYFSITPIQSKSRSNQATIRTSQVNNRVRARKKGSRAAKKLKIPVSMVRASIAVLRACTACHEMVLFSPLHPLSVINRFINGRRGPCVGR